MRKQNRGRRRVEEKRNQNNEVTQELQTLPHRIEEIRKKRREAEKSLEKLLLEMEILHKKRDMLMSLLQILGSEAMSTADRITKKMWLLVQLRSAVKDDIQVSTLVEIHRKALITNAEKYVREIGKAFDEAEIEKAISSMKELITLLKTIP